MITAVIFDWDGVIVDSMPLLAKGFQETALAYGVEISVQEVIDGYFQPAEEYYKKLGVIEEDKALLRKKHSAATHTYKRLAEMFSESFEVLSFLHERGIALGVVSNGETEYLLEQIKRFDLGEFFSPELVLGEDIPKEGKIKKILETLSVSKDEVLYVGDLPSDISAARANNISVAAIERRPEALKRLAALEPDHTFSSLDDLKLLVK